MAREIAFLKDTVGLEKANGKTRFHCIVELKEDGKVVGRKMIQGCVDAADLESRASSWAEEVDDTGEKPSELTDEERLEAIKSSISDSPVPQKKGTLEIG